MVRFCASAEALIERADHLLYCPVDGDKAIGWADAMVALCKHDPDTCPVIQAILKNRETSKQETHYVSHLPTHTGQAAADDPHGSFMVRPVRWKR
ncbi:hypothetical protein DCC61_04630 [Candidatus Microgenomates bacterium]|nr:MAG: hypothetical protein DCC61_04630 [Candidatus Microgenomates bacterium]